MSGPRGEIAGTGTRATAEQEPARLAGSHAKPRETTVRRASRCV